MWRTATLAKYAPIIGNITLHDNPLLLKLRVRKPVRAQHRRLCRFLLLSIDAHHPDTTSVLAVLGSCQSNILEVRLVLFQLTPQIVVMIAYRLVYRLQ